VNVGQRTIVHLVGGKADLTSGCLSCLCFSFDSANKDGIAIVKKEPYGDVYQPGDKVRVEFDKSHIPKKKIIRRACSQVGQTGYNLLFYNCEHFARWCRYEKAESKQIQVLGNRILKTMAFITFCVLILVAIYIYIYIY
jgi:hypothetical protein